MVDLDSRRRTYYKIEIAPAVDAEKGSCEQDCPHCPLSSISRSARGGQRASDAPHISDEVAEAIRLTTIYLGFSGSAKNEYFDTILAGFSYNPEGAPLRKAPLILTGVPNNLVFPIGPLSLGTNYEGLLQKHLRRFPFWSFQGAEERDITTKVAFGFQAPLEQGRFTYTADFAQEVARSGKAAIESICKNDNPQMSSKALVLSESWNAFNLPTDFTENKDVQKLVEDKVEETIDLFTKILPKDSAERMINRSSPLHLHQNISERGIFFNLEIETPLFDLSYICRLMPPTQNASKKVMPLSDIGAYKSGISSFSLMFTPSAVIVNHGTMYILDKTTHVSYQEYYECLEAAKNSNDRLIDILREKIRERRESSGNLASARLT